MNSPLPPRPNFLTTDDRNRLSPAKQLSPHQKRAALAVLATALERQLNNHPSLQPLTVHVDTRPDGFSLHVDVPPMTADDVRLSIGNGDAQPGQH